MNVWTLTTNTAGMRNQALALAHALSPDTLIEKEVRLSFFLRKMPSFLYPFLSKFVRTAEFQSPWPDYIICCGRQATLVALALRRRNRYGTYIINIQDPYISPSYFDMVIALQHDHLMGRNVISTIAGLSRWSSTDFQTYKKEKKVPWVTLPFPYFCIFVGGNARGLKFTEQGAQKLNKIITDIYTQYKATIVISFSRRTPEAFKKAIKISTHIPHYIFDPMEAEGIQNPYPYMLAQATAIFITSDSVSMISEAVNTGTPIYVLQLHTGHRKKLAEFVDNLTQKGYIKLYSNSIEGYRYTPLNETPKVAKYVMKMCPLKPEDSYENYHKL